MNRIVIYTSARCPYCVMAKELLDEKGVPYREVRVDLDPAHAVEVRERSGGRRTVPQIFVGDHHVGGCDELYAMDARGELAPLLERAA